MAVWLTSYGKLKDAVAMIQEHPQVDRIPPELKSLNIAPYRQVLSGMNRVIYEHRGDTADIHIVGATRRDLQGASHEESRQFLAVSLCRTSGHFTAETAWHHFC
ncbi:MAG: hypothetical protein QMB17_01045 [Polaromonas sp.]